MEKQTKSLENAEVKIRGREYITRNFKMFNWIQEEKAKDKG